MNPILRAPVYAISRVYLVWVAAITLLYGVINVRILSQFALGDWLINYAGGFVRRGLFGEGILLFAHLSPRPLYLLLAIQISLYAVVWFFLWTLAKQYPWDLWSLALWLSPATLAFTVLDPPGAYRKEILLFALLCGICAMLRSGVSLPKVSFALTAGIVVMALCHEALLLFMPYLLAPFLILTPDLKRFLKISILPVLAGAATLLLVISHPGTPPQRQIICQTVVNTVHSKNETICAGAIDAIGVSQNEEHQMVVRSMRRSHYLSLYGTYALLGLLPLSFALAAHARIAVRRRSVRIVVFTGVLSVCLTIPLFYGAIDWGRWIYIHLLCLLLLVFFAFAKPRADLGKQMTVANVLPSGPAGPLAAIALIAYTLLWTLPYYGDFPPRSGYLGLAKYLRGHQSARQTPRQ
jgi:hypothetical protein